MRTVVFTNSTDFTIHHQVKTIGQPINDKKEYDTEAIFHRQNEVENVTFFVPIGLDEYGNHSVSFTRISLSAGQIKAVQSMIDSIELRIVEDGKKEWSDDLPF